MTDYISTILPTIQSLGIWGYWFVLLASVLEAVPPMGFVLPSGIIVGMFGFFAAQGYYELGNLIWFAAIGAILGDWVSYYLGTKGVRFFRHENKIFRLSHLEKAKHFFKKHGGKSVLLGRFISPIRPLIPFVAGLSGMNKWVFSLWNVIGGFLWSVLILLIGYFSGGAVQTIGAWSTRAGLLILFIAAAVFILWFLIRKSSSVFRFLTSISISIAQAIIANPDVRTLVEKYPATFRFLQNRFDRTKFSGLTFTLLGAVFVYVFFLFIGTIEDIINADAIAGADVRVANLLYALRDNEMLRLFTWVTLLGKWEVIAGASIAFLSALWMWGKRRYILPFLVTIAGAGFLNVLAKLAIHRPRPELGFYAEQTLSFPSGHASLSVAFYGFVAYVLLRGRRTWKSSAAILFWTLFLILMIGFSRLYLGVHFLSDVWGGYLMGMLWLLIGISSAEMLRHKPYPTFLQETSAATRAKFFTAGLFTLLLIFYVGFAFQYNPLPGAPAIREEKVVTGDVVQAFADAKLPRYTETLLASSQEPLNFIFVAQNDRQLKNAMLASGWSLADPVTISSVLAVGKAALLNEEYPAAPMTPSFWNTRMQDMGFEKSNDASTVREWHQVRIWKSSLKFPSGYDVYVATARFDTASKWLVIHKINPDIDTEREFLYNNLQATGLIASSRKEQFVEPVPGKNFSGDPFFTDGKMYLVFLK